VLAGAAYENAEANAYYGRTMMKKQVMTPDHLRWEEFIQRLEGPEGCHFQGEYDDKGELILDSVTWECAGGDDKSKAAAILGTMPQIDLPASLTFFEKHGGVCDCEIVFNVEMSYRARVENDNHLHGNGPVPNGLG
jgi:hypothetical protein